MSQMVQGGGNRTNEKSGVTGGHNTKRQNWHTMANSDSRMSSQSNSRQAGSPERKSKLVTLLRVAPRDASIASRQQTRCKPMKAALQEKKSQYLEYAARVEERRRESAIADLKVMGQKDIGQSASRHSADYRIREGLKVGSWVKTNPQRRQDPCSDFQMSKQPPPSKPRRHFSQSPPRPVARASRNLPNSQLPSESKETPKIKHEIRRPTHVPDERNGQHRIFSHLNSQHIPKSKEAQISKRKPKSLYPLPEYTVHARVPQVPPRKTSKSPDKPRRQLPNVPESTTQHIVQAEVHGAPQSTSDAASPRYSFPTGSLPKEEETLNYASKSYPPSSHPQSVDHKSRMSSSKADLHKDLSCFDGTSAAFRKKITSPDESDSASEPRHSVPSGSLPREKSVRTSFEKEETQNHVSKSYPPSSPSHSQSADPKSRISANKADLHKDLKYIDITSSPRKRITSADESDSASKPRHSVPSGFLLGEKSVRTSVEKEETQNHVSKSYPPSRPSRSQSADPKSRISANKADLHKDLKYIDATNAALRKRITSPDESDSASIPPSSSTPHAYERFSRLDHFLDARQVSKASSRTHMAQYQEAKAFSKLKVKQRVVHDDKTEVRVENKDPKHQTSFDPEPTPRHRRSRNKTTQPDPIAKTENPCKGSKGMHVNSQSSPQIETVSGPQAPLRLQKSAEHKVAIKLDENKSVSTEREGKPTSKFQARSAEPSTEYSVEQAVKSSKSCSENSGAKPKWPKSSVNQELHHRRAAILNEGKNPDRKTKVVDTILDSSLHQDFEGELYRKLAKQKSRLEESLKREGVDVCKVEEGQTPAREKGGASERNGDMKLDISILSDSGLGSSCDSQSNAAKDELIHKNQSLSKLDAPEDQGSTKEAEFVISEWSDEVEMIKPTDAEVQKSDNTGSETPLPSTSIPLKTEAVLKDELKRNIKLRRRKSASSVGENLQVDRKPLSKSIEDKSVTTKTSFLSSMKLGISVPDLALFDDSHKDSELFLDDIDGLLNVTEIEGEFEKSFVTPSSNDPSKFTPPPISPKLGAPSSKCKLEDSEEAPSNPPSSRHTTPPNERLLQSSSSHHLERSHQSLRQLPIKVLPTSVVGTNFPTFSEDHDMSVMLPSQPVTPSQVSKSTTDQTQKKSRYLKLAGMQLLPQKLQLITSRDRSKTTSPARKYTRDEVDGPQQGIFKKNSEERGRDMSRRAFPKVRRRSASADGFFSFHRDLSFSPLQGLRGFGTPSRQSKLKDRRGRQKMLTPPNNHALRMPRQPRPQRMHTILESLKKGLKDTIEISKEKLTVMEQHSHDPQTTSSRQGFHYNLDKQIKVAERYIRKLQFHLAKVEEVYEQYDKELKVREGAVNVVKAYADTNLPHAKEPSSEAKAGVRDCTQSLCQMEAELEANLGAFIVKIEGIAGFARVCRGDIFEVVFKYGLQKWKARCKVEKDLIQSWDIEEIAMYPMLADFLTIKVTEMRGLARSNMVIGSLEFDTSDFYQADPQTLTIDVNETGTIKLNLVVTWSPFHINEEVYKSPKNSYSRRERAFTESVINSPKSPNTSAQDSSKSPKKHPPKTLDLTTSPTLTLDEAMHNVTRLLEILKGQYTELDLLEKQVGQLNDLLMRIRERKKHDSTMSLMVRNALESFDFLNDVDEDDGCLAIDSGSSSMDENRSSITSDDFCKSQSSSERLSDCASLDDPPHPPRDSTSYDHQTPPPLNLSMIRANRSSRIINISEKRESRLIEMNEQRETPPLFHTYGRCWEEGSENIIKLTTGSDSIDMVSVQHLMYIEYLLSHLGALGPLKLKETVALQKLKKQAVIIEHLIVLAVSSTSITTADDVFPELKLKPLLLEFWQHCAEKEALYVNAESFLLQLDVKFGAKLRTSHPDIADDVFQSLCNRIIERPVDLYSPKTIITLFQYIGFFATDDRKHPEKFINDLSKDFELTASLEPSNADLLKVLKKLPKGSLLSTGNLRALGLLLLEDRAAVQTGVKVYLESITREEKMRKKAVNVYLECLEERDLSLRQAGCAAIAALKANEALEQLLYLLRCDMDDVKSTAKEALMAFGDEGKQAYEQISYTPYGSYNNHDYSEIDVPVMTTEL